MKYLLFLFALLLGASKLHVAQAQMLINRYYNHTETSIVVSDKESRDPLIGAVVQIINRADTLRGVTIKRNWGHAVSAVYECNKIFRDSVDLSVRYLGYKNFHKRYSEYDFANYISVEMEIDQTQIAQVVVMGEQVAMVFRGDTTVYNAGAFKTFSDDRLSELLKQLPGVEVRENKIYAQGEEVKRVYVDGRNLFGANASFSLTDMEASDVKNIRVYEEQSPEARYMGDTSAPKEKVMDVETKSKRTVLLGGEVAALGGASFEKDYSGRAEVRHLQSGLIYRHAETGSLRLGVENSKDVSDRNDVSMSSKITPSKKSSGEVTYEFRRGDTLTVVTSATFSRGKTNSSGAAAMDYFPTEAYALRREENSSLMESRTLSANVNHYTSILRGKNNLTVSMGLNLNSGTSMGRNQTSQRIDEQSIFTRTHSDNNNRDLALSSNVVYRRMLLDKRLWLSVDVSYEYQNQRQEGWRIDTLASEVGLRVKLNDDGRGRHNATRAGSDIQFRVSDQSSLSAGYEFKYDNQRSRQLAIDYLDNPHGVVDTINSYDYTVNYYSNSVSANYSLNTDKVQFMASLQGAVYQLARDERFPAVEQFPRTFFQLSPFINMSTRSERHRFYCMIMSNPQIPAAEMLRGTLNATNPLSLQAGNPDLKMPNQCTTMARYELINPQTARTFSFGLSGGYTFNYITSQRKLFTEEEYLPQYDYTAQRGAQLNTQVNVAGNYNLGTSVSYSQRLARIRSTVNAAMRYNFSESPYFLEEKLFASTRHQLSVGVGISTGFSTKVKINLSSDTNMSSYTTQSERAFDLREQLNVRIDLRFGKYFGSLGTRYEYYCNSRSQSLTRHNVMTNLAAGRKFGKKERFSISVGASDVFNRPDNTITRFETDYIRTSTTFYLGRYGYLRAAYTF